MDPILRLVTQRWTIDGNGRWVPRRKGGDAMSDYALPQAQLDLLGEIIEGEAGCMGNIGMYAVATTLAQRIADKQSFPRIAREYYARKAPSEYAALLARQVLLGNLPGCGFSFCYSRADMDRGGYPPADYRIIHADGGDGHELHLFREWPVETMRRQREAK